LITLSEKRPEPFQIPTKVLEVGATNFPALIDIPEFADMLCCPQAFTTTNFNSDFSILFIWDSNFNTLSNSSAIPVLLAIPKLHVSVPGHAVISLIVS
jgi:hypothetical protein